MIRADDEAFRDAVSGRFTRGAGYKGAAPAKADGDDKATAVTDLGETLKTSEEELANLEREHETEKKLIEGEHAVEDQRNKVAGLRDRIKTQAKEALKPDASVLPDPEKELRKAEDDCEMADAIADAAGALLQRLDRFEAQRLAERI